MVACTDTLSIPPEAVNALPLIEHLLGTSLVAVYLHGSAAAQGLRKQSDVDLLVVVGKALPASVRARLAAELLSVSGHYPLDPMGRRPLEVIVFRLGDLEQITYPARAEFVYGEWLRSALESGSVSQAEVSPEFTLLLAQARREALPLVGPGIATILPDTPLHVIRRAIRDLLPGLVESVEGDERNVLLTLARMWRTLQAGEFFSKDAAADWAGPQLSRQAAGILALARNAYLCHGDEDLHLRSMEVSQTVEEMRERILGVLRHL